MKTKSILKSLPFVIIVSACFVLGGEREHSALESVLIEDVPHIRQRQDFCGEACAAMYLQKLGFDYTQDDVFNCSGLDPLKGRGCFTAELKTTLENIGFETGKVRYYIDANDSDNRLDEQFKRLHESLKQGIPSICCMRYDDKPAAPEHFRLILGYDAKTDSVIYHEPAEYCGSYKKMPRQTFYELWPLKYDAKKWLLVRFSLIEDKIKEPEKSKSFTDADYAQHIKELKTKIPDSSFSIVLTKPFVVIGDESASMVKYRAEKTVNWAVDKLKADYFENDPCSIIDIWLFDGEKSYRKYTRQIFNDEPTTPFGYFSDEHNSLIMNIATGGGTLVHEIVHPFIAANFPDCPAWFNEGLASLYEQSSEKNGKICGLTNWRLRGLKEKIKDGTLPTFKELTHTTTFEFYRGSAGGDNYAQARYLCYYLQEKNLLRKFYHEFKSQIKSDPTGYKTLLTVLRIDDINKFENDWQKWILKLTFP